MRAEVLNTLLAKLAECDASDEAKAEFRKLILQVDASHKASPETCDERARFARHLFDINESRAAVRDRLMRRYGVSRAQAYRYIAEALEIVSCRETK